LKRIKELHYDMKEFHRLKLPVNNLNLFLGDRNECVTSNGTLGTYG